MLQCLKQLKLHEISSKTVYECSKFIRNNFHFLLFSIFITYLQSPRKVSCAIGISHWMTGSYVKSIKWVNFVCKLP